MIEPGLFRKEASIRILGVCAQVLEKARHAWLAGAVIALLGLPGPLCILACIEDAPLTSAFATLTSSASSAPPASPAGEMPCHEQAPSGPIGLEHDCDCSTASAPFLQAFEAPAQLAGVVLRAPSYYALARRNALEPSVPRVERIPSPDILLQKSTLIV